MFVVSKKNEMANKTFRFPTELLARLDVVAKKNNVSVNALLRQMAEYALADMEVKR